MAFREALETFSEEEQLEQLHELSADECDALYDLLLTGALIDGEMSHEEAELMEEEFAHLPFYGAAHSAEVRREHGFMQRGALLERIASGEVEEILDSVAARLTDDGHRRAALRALALVLDAGSVVEDELSYAMQAAKAMKIDGVDALEILRKAWEYNHPPFSS